MKYSDMSVYNGRKLKIEISGASHSPQLVASIFGLDGMTFDKKELAEFMSRRSAKRTAYSTSRMEPDDVIFTSGLIHDKIIGPLRAVIKNTCARSSDYNEFKDIPRPSHADYAARIRYGDDYDFVGGGKFSGRMTAPICIVGGIIKQILAKRGICISAYISRIGKVHGTTYDYGTIIAPSDKFFPLLNESFRLSMDAEIESARSNSDSVGGTIDCIITGVPAGQGESMFDSIEGIISRLAFAVPAVKGIEFGSGFSLAEMRGSEANDAFFYEGNAVKTRTNHSGGINGGLSNGMPITFRVAIRPTPSIGKAQDSVDLQQKIDCKLQIKGRHDVCIVPRAVPVIEAIAAIGIYDICD